MNVLQVLAESGDNEWVNRINVSKSAVTVQNVTGLKPYTQYNVRVVAILLANDGESVYSLPYGPARTGEDG